MNDFAIFDRLIPNFTLSMISSNQLFGGGIESHDFLEHTEIGSWLRQINADDVFTIEFSKYIKSKKIYRSLIFINTKINQINCILIYVVIKKTSQHKTDLCFYNIIEIANLISNNFSKGLWDVIAQSLVKEHNSIIRRNLETSYIALESLFTMCHSNFQELGKSKYCFGEILFYLNHNYKWDRAGAGFKENSARVVLQQLPRSKSSSTIPEFITNQCLANHQLENNIFISL